MEWTFEMLASVSVHRRHELWKIARKKTSTEAQQLRRLIENCGLPYSSALKQGDPLVQKMTKIINSAKAVRVAIEATEAGLPAMQGVDPILSIALGVDYGPHNRATNEAGYLISQMMKSKGYVNSGRKGSLPSYCIAKTAEIFVRYKNTQKHTKQDKVAG